MAYNAATPIVDGQTVIYTGQGRGTKAVKIEKQGDGFATKELWSNAQLAVQFNTPVLKDGFLFGLSDKGNLFCINAKTGESAWTDTNRLSNFGAILDAGSCLLAQPEKSELIAFKPDGKEFGEITKYKVADTPIYAHPIIAGKRVFVKDQESVALWMLE
jgi:outer membrane protein assembly factor BamB